MSKNPKTSFRITITTVTYFTGRYSRNVGVPVSESNVRPVDFDLSVDASSAQAEGTTCFQLVYSITQQPKPTPYFTFALDKVSGSPNNKQSFKSSWLSTLTMTFGEVEYFILLATEIPYVIPTTTPMAKPSSLALSRWIRIKNLRGIHCGGEET